MTPPRYLLLANPAGKRCQAYLTELQAFWAERGGQPIVDLLPWREVVPRRGDLAGLTDLDRPALVRLESPGKDFEVAKLLLQLGAQETGETGTDYLSLTHDKGRQVRPGLLQRGFERVLAGVKATLADHPQLVPTACPRAIAEMFDKNATSTRLAEAGLPVPESLVAPDSAPGLLDLLRQHRYRTAYVKLNTGSSASCMIVVHPLDEPAWGWSSLVRLKGGFYSTRRLCRYQGDDLHAVLDFLIAEGACVQRGIPMAQLDGQNFDVRVVMLAGEPAFHIFRLSGQPMTNLHFGGRRGQPDECRRAIPMRAWLDAMDHCRAAAALYPCDMIGIDLLFERGYLRHYLLEVNAFGDFFPGLRDAQGQTVHARAIALRAAHHG